MYRTTANARAKDEFQYLTLTYGQEFASRLREWIQLIVTEATKKKPIGLSVNDVLDDVLSPEAVTAGTQQRQEPAERWRHIKKRLRDASWSRRIRAFAVVLSQRRPPWELFSVTAYFRCWR